MKKKTATSNNERTMKYKICPNSSLLQRMMILTSDWATDSHATQLSKSKEPCEGENETEGGPNLSTILSIFKFSIQSKLTQPTSISDIRP
jgi:hypothetical protein